MNPYQSNLLSIVWGSRPLCAGKLTSRARLSLTSLPLNRWMSTKGNAQVPNLQRDEDSRAQVGTATPPRSCPITFNIAQVTGRIRYRPGHLCDLSECGGPRS